MICRVCKTENEDRFTYCKNCGTKLEKPVRADVDTMPVSPYVGQPGVPPAGQPSAGAFDERPPVLCQPVGSVPVMTEEPLVPVMMLLPDPEDVTRRTLQKVFVTPAQRRAMEQAGLLAQTK